MDEWQEKKGAACLMATSQETPDFESITGDLSVRAKSALARLGVMDVAALQQLRADSKIRLHS